jgi:hypothetical protein
VITFLNLLFHRDFSPRPGVGFIISRSGDCVMKVSAAIKRFLCESSNDSWPTLDDS